jgi:hypothetical protein
MESVVIDLVAPIMGFFVGTFLFSRVGGWLHAIVTAVKASKNDDAPKGTVAIVAVLSSGPWLMAGVIFWAAYVLSDAHARAWDWFFGAVVVAIPVWILFSVHLYRRGKRIQAAAPKEPNAV